MFGALEIFQNSTNFEHTKPKLEKCKAFFYIKNQRFFKVLLAPILERETEFSQALSRSHESIAFESTKILYSKFL
jgi:hypothetical protein